MHKHLASGILLSWLVCLPINSALAQKSEEAELAQVTKAITAIKSRLQDTSAEKDTVSKQLRESEQAINQLQQQTRALTKSIETNKTELASLQLDAAKLEQSRSEQQDLIGSYLQSAYRTGSEPTLKLLLNQDDVRLGSRMLRYYQYLNAARSERIDAYRLTLRNIAAVSANIEQSTQQISTEQAALLAQRSELESSRKKRSALLASLETQLANDANELKKLEQQRLALEQLLEQIRINIASLSPGDSGQPFAQRKGKLPWPLKGSLKNSFGSKHTLGDLTWEGINLVAPAGTQVNAIHNGRIVFADWFSGSGLLLIIDHGDGYMSLYAHAQELFRREGEWVRGGEVVAAAGDTGGQKDPGLYFEIRRNGKAEDPVRWLQARK